VRAIARTLEIREQPGQPLRSTLIARLSERQLLLVLDNCEHVIQDVAPLAHEIVSQTGGAAILATSREALGLPGETKWVIPSL